MAAMCIRGTGGGDFGLLLCLVCALGCAGPRRAAHTPPPQGQPQPASRPEQRPVMQRPRVFPALPDGPLLDLGPILRNRTTTAMAVADALLVAGARLGADGFVQERRDLHAIYDDDRIWPPSTSGSEALNQLLLTDETDTAARRNAGDRRSYYRAFRRVPRLPPAVSIELGQLRDLIRQQLEGTANAGEQLALTHRLFVAQIITPDLYEAVRAHILAKLLAAEHPAATSSGG